MLVWPCRHSNISRFVRAKTCRVPSTMRLKASGGLPGETCLPDEFVICRIISCPRIEYPTSVDWLFLKTPERPDERPPIESSCMRLERDDVEC